MEKKDQYHWDRVIVNKEIIKNNIFKKLDTQNEILFPLEHRDTFIKKSCNISFYEGELSNYKNNKDISYYKCKAHFYQSDTLYITIEYEDGFSSRGFIIKYKNNTFCTTINETTDMAFEVENNLQYFKTIYQKLTLDKSNYQMGDSIFGYINFKINEYNKDVCTTYNGKGYFKTKITKYLFVMP